MFMFIGMLRFIGWGGGDVWPDAEGARPIACGGGL